MSSIIQHVPNNYDDFYILIYSYFFYIKMAKIPAHVLILVSDIYENGINIWWVFRIQCKKKFNEILVFYCLVDNPMFRTPLLFKTSLVIWWFFTVFQSKDPVGYNEITLNLAYRSNINYHMFTHCLKSYLQRTFLIGHFMSYRSKSSNDPDKTSIKWTHTVQEH